MPSLLTPQKSLIPSILFVLKWTKDMNYLKTQVRTIKEYNEKFVKRKLNPEKGHRCLPYIVVLIDEFADLIMTAGKNEHPIARIAPTFKSDWNTFNCIYQRPSVNVITGMIKANFPQELYTLQKLTPEPF